MVEKEQKNKDCVFCKIIAGDIPADKIYDSDNFIVMNDAHPVAVGHCLIIPKKHFVNLLDLPSTLGTELLDIVKKQSLRLIKEKKAEGFNILQNNFKAAGQVVMHSHLHIIPRKNNDGLKV